MQREDPDIGEVSADRATAADQRTAPRFLYEYVQGIFPVLAETAEAAELVRVDCHDLSEGGFSFFLDSQPDFDSLAACLGRPPATIRVQARVVYAKPTEDDRYLVGCRFVKQLEEAD